MNAILIILAVVAVLFIGAYIVSAIQQKRRNSELDLLNDRLSAAAEEDEDEDEEEEAEADDEDEEDEDDEDENENENENENDKDDDKEKNNNRSAEPAKTTGCGGCLSLLIMLLMVGGIGYLFFDCFTEKLDDHMVITTLGSVEHSPFINEKVTYDTRALKDTTRQEVESVSFSSQVLEHGEKDSRVYYIVETKYSTGEVSIDTISRPIDGSDWTTGF